MKYALYEAVDTRDNKPMLWLHDCSNHRVALFFVKTAPSRIKQRTAAASDSIVWGNTEAWYLHAALGAARLVDKWEFSS